MDTKDIQIEEIKFDDEGGTFEGWASRYGVKDAGGDVVEFGAFDKTLKSRKTVKMLWNHDTSAPIGKWNSIESREKGLWVKGQILLSLAKGKEVYELMKSGIVDGLSIGYRTVRDRVDTSAKTRILQEIDLYEISAVLFPMESGSRVQTVKADGSCRLASVRDLESILREAGVPNAFAKLCATHGFDGAKKMLATGQRDADESRELATMMMAATKLVNGD